MSYKYETLLKTLDLSELEKMKAQTTEALDLLNRVIKEKRPRFPVGAVYGRRGHECLYSLVDWNGEIRFINLTNSYFWKNTMKSRKTHSRINQTTEKANYLLWDEMKNLLVGENISQFFLVAETLTDASNFQQ